MKFASRQFGWMFRLVRFFFASALLVVSIPLTGALAQSTDDPWAEPVNLSRSGVATNPAIVSDSEGAVHVVWQDDLDKYVYTRLEGDQWSPPQTTNLDDLFVLTDGGGASSRSQLGIYTGPNPFFVAGPGQYMFAFWITPLGRLWTSRVRNGDFERVSAWDSVSLITPKAASFAAAVDARGEWHLAYLRTADEPGYPPGIYYTHSKSSGRYWAEPVLLYESSYFRGLGEGEAHLSLVTAGTAEAPRIYVAWDNRPRKQVLLAQSADGGKSWDQPTLIAGPAPDSELAGPFNIHIGANENSVVLVWQDGVPESACSQVYQSSSDGGATWSGPLPMFEDLFGCAQSIEFATGLANGLEGSLYFLTETVGEVFLTAWNGLQWNQPQAQPILSGFEEPEIYTEVIYGCHRAALSGERLYLVGCDEGGGGDVWVTSRGLGPDTFTVEPPVWSQLSSVTSDALDIAAVELVSTDDGLTHAFFSQHRDRVIYYTYWDSASWSHMTPVMKLPDGEAGSPAIAVGPGNELFLIVPNNKGSLYFSRATSSSAAAKSNWSAPTQLGTGQDGQIGSVDVAWDATGTIYVAYSVPVNEQRGIYLVQSKDHGASWSEAFQLFDGTLAGFDLVGAPSLLTSKDGSLHVIWKQQSIQGDGVSQPLSLYYTRSDDGGRTFNDAELVIEESMAWREIVADDEGNLHLLWQQNTLHLLWEENTVTTVWDQISLDGGNTWQTPQGLPNKGRLAAVTRDPVGRLHLVGVGPGVLNHWLWDGRRWQPETSLEWSLASQESPVELLEAAVNKHGEMVVVLVIPTGPGDPGQKMLFYSTRTLELPQEQTEIQEVPTQTQLPATLAPATSTPEVLLTPTALIDNGSVNPNQNEGAEPDGPVAPLTSALLPVALLLLGVLGFVIRQVAQSRDR